MTNNIKLMDYLFSYKKIKGSNRRGIYKPCKYCGKMFFVTIGVFKYGFGKFCSRECLYKFNKGENHKQYKRIKYICKYCGKEFFVTPYKDKNCNVKYCSKKCFTEAQKHFEEYSGINNPNWKGGGKSIRICKYCGKSFEVNNGEINKGRGKFCSRECWYAYQVGENCPNWKGGLSFEPYCHKFNNTKKEEIREKHNRQCFICGKSEEENKQRLSIHHVDYNKKQGCDDHKWILVPLCASCHAKTNNNRNLWEYLLKYKLWCLNV